jgi:predicted RNA binding protein YcfA (HicA-like mRNA interferase family)
MNKRKLLEKVLAGPKNVHFNDMILLVEAFGFRLSRVRGSHHIFEHPQIPELVNLQEKTVRPNPTKFVSFCS